MHLRDIEGWRAAPAAIFVTGALILLAPQARANNVILSSEGCGLGCTTSLAGMVTLPQNVGGISAGPGETSASSYGDVSNAGDQGIPEPATEFLLGSALILLASIA